jgi:hypothetical protein
MRRLPLAAVILAFAASAMLPASAQVAQSQPGATPGCQPFTAPVIIGGETRQAVGQACRQPDGSWRITQDTPGLPQQVFVLPPQPAYPYPYPYPYWAYGPPWWYGPSFVFVRGFHHHPHGHHR